MTSVGDDPVADSAAPTQETVPPPMAHAASLTPAAATRTVESRLPTALSGAASTASDGSPVLTAVGPESTTSSGSDGSVRSAFHFARTLQSEVDVATCFDLLLGVHSTTTLFGEWSVAELQLLSQVVTVLRFGAGESVIEAGEASSFVAILLAGALEVRIAGVGGDAAPPKKMAPGGLLGEMSCFIPGGTRTAEVRAAADSTHIAILTFSELESLKDIVPDLRTKLLCTFAIQGLKKLLDQTPTTVAAPATTTATPPAATTTTPSLASRQPLDSGLSSARRNTSLPSSRSGSPVLGSVRSLDSKGSSGSAGDKGKRVGRRATLQTFGSVNLFANANGANATANGTAATTTTTTTTNGNASGRRAESMFRKRGVEHAPVSDASSDAMLASQRAAKHRLTTIQLVLTSQEKQLLVRTQQVDGLTQDLARASQEKKDLLALVARRDATLTKVKGERDTLQTDLAEAQQRASILDRTVTVLQSQVSGAIADASAQTSAAKEEAAARDSAAEQTRAELEKEIRTAREATAIVTAEYTAHKTKSASEVAALREEVDGQQVRIASLESELLVWRQRHADGQAALHQLATSHRVTSQEAEEIGVAKLQSQRLFVATSDRLSATARDLHAYKKILKRAVVASYVHEQRRRTQLTTLCSELAAVHGELRVEASKSSEESKSPTGTDLIDAVPATPPAQSRAAQRRSARKSAKATAFELLSHATDLVSQVRPLLVEVCRLKAYWKDLSGSFLARTIELTQENGELTRTNHALAKERKTKQTTRGTAPPKDSNNKRREDDGHAEAETKNTSTGTAAHSGPQSNHRANSVRSHASGRSAVSSSRPESVSGGGTATRPSAISPTSTNDVRGVSSSSSRQFAFDIAERGDATTHASDEDSQLEELGDATRTPRHSDPTPPGPSGPLLSSLSPRHQRNQSLSSRTGASPSSVAGTPSRPPATTLSTLSPASATAPVNGLPPVSPRGASAASRSPYARKVRLPYIESKHVSGGAGGGAAAAVAPTRDRSPRPALSAAEEAHHRRHSISTVSSRSPYAPPGEEDALSRARSSSTPQHVLHTASPLVPAGAINGSNVAPPAANAPPSSIGGAQRIYSQAQTHRRKQAAPAASTAAGPATARSRASS